MGSKILMNLEEIDRSDVNFFGALPEGFIAEALALTSPRDACRLSLVDSAFRSEAEWDAVWENFLPPEYQKIVEEAVGDVRASKKELYLRLCDHPLIIDGGNKSLWLEKESGKKCYMLAARSLSIAWSDTPAYWTWTSIPQSRFAEAAQLIDVCWLEIRGQISTSILSPNTNYAAYLVFNTTPKAYGFEYQPVELCFGPVGAGATCETRTMYLDPQAGQRRKYQPRRRIGMFNRGAFANYEVVVPPSKENGPKPRGDGWLEVRIGEYFNKEDGEAAQLQRL